MTFGERIKARREELDLSQDRLAKLLGYKSRSTINKIELGKTDIGQSKIVALARVLETTTGYLLGDNDTTPQQSDIEQLYNQLDTNDKAEIRGEMKQMLKADKYNNGITPINIKPFIPPQNNSNIVWTAARSTDHKPPGFTRLTDEELERIRNAPPVTSEDDL